MTKFLLLTLCFCMASCKTHQVILDQGGELPYKETKFVQTEEETTSTNLLNPIQRRLDLLERNSVNKQELDEAVESLKRDLQEVKDQLSQLKTNLQPLKKVDSQESEKEEDLFAEAEKNFKEKKWKDAILTYEKFRTGKPQSPDFKVATFKIGKSFIDLGYPQEAQVFFEEVIARFPNSSEAKEAQKILTQQK